jgi:hypothetical protein
VELKYLVALDFPLGGTLGNIRAQKRAACSVRS